MSPAGAHRSHPRARSSPMQLQNQSDMRRLVSDRKPAEGGACPRTQPGHRCPSLHAEEAGPGLFGGEETSTASVFLSSVAQ